ncbi:MAG: DUF115 domain-containing protein [Actinomycetales bacterium]|nr:DUF115 domain-containing protein [Actinomycetales bacterium]
MTPSGQPRFETNELTVKRALGAVGRRVSAIPERTSWKISGGQSRNREKLENFKNRHQGQTGVIIANGPSINKTDMSILKDFHCFSMNRAYLAWTDWGFTPAYFVSINGLVLSQFASEIAELQCTKFLDARSRSGYSSNRDDLILLNTRYGLVDEFDGSGKVFSTGGTVTFVAMQLAFLMGFSRVVLVGLDHRFGSKVNPNETATRDGAPDQDHFRPDYFPPGTKWQGPDLKRSEVAYAIAREAYSRAGRTIVDATVGGDCQVFDKVPLEAAVNR